MSYTRRAFFGDPRLLAAPIHYCLITLRDPYMYIHPWIAGLCASVQTRVVTRLRPVDIALLPSNGAAFIGCVSVSRHYQCLVSRDLDRPTPVTFCSPYLRKRARVFQRADEDVQR